MAKDKAINNNNKSVALISAAKKQSHATYGLPGAAVIVCLILLYSLSCFTIIVPGIHMQRISHTACLYS